MSTSCSRLSRRRFLKTTTTAAVTFPTLCAFGQELRVKIDRIEVFPVRYPTHGFFKFFSGPRGEPGLGVVIVKITASDGTIGWGQSVPTPKWAYESLETATVAIRRYFGPAMIGHDPTDIAGANQIMDRTIKPAFSTGMPITRAAIELGLHDLTGKLMGVSLSQLWNRPRGGPISLSWTINARTLDDVESLVEQGRQRGYRHFNIKVAPDPKFDVALAKKVRALAPNAFLWADANGGYDPQTALEAAPKLADVGVDVLEAPIRPNRISGYQALRRQGALPILMDEGVVSPVELVEFIRLKMIDGVAMKPARCGGLMSNKRQIEIIQDAGLMWLGSGLTDPDISLAASLALYGAYGLDKPAALNGPQFLAADVLAKPLQIEDAVAQIPTGPGLGVDVDQDKVLALMNAGKSKADD